MAGWARRAIWRVLDTHFLDGSGFASLWARWEQDPQRPAILHYVAITPVAPDLTRLRALMPGRRHPDFPAPLPGTAGSGGFHRLEFADGQVLLTLCVGPLRAMLREQQFLADAICLEAATDGLLEATWDIWTVKALVRLCRRGTLLQLPSVADRRMPALERAGFVPDAPSGAQPPSARYAPPWEPGATREPWRTLPAAPSDCVVIGAGLAGACVAAALARRHWRVEVVDAAPAPAAGASGLPAGLLVPQHSRDDAARSRLSRAGVRLTLQWCRRLLREGEDWDCSGVRQRVWDSGAVDSLWHADAGWIKPARLVAACLSVHRVSFRGGTCVQALVHDAGQWLLLDATGREVARTTHVVLAAAGNTTALLDATRTADGRPFPDRVGLRALAAVHGQVSWGLQHGGDALHFPPGPVNGHGHLLPAVPVEGGMAWFVGATYEPDTAPALDEAHAHAENRRRLSQLLPQAEQALAPRFDAGLVSSWRGTRSTTRDRLPGVGALQDGPAPTLWMNAGMGSRGLTYAVLGAELLAARMGGEPLPIEASLARLLAATRPAMSHHL
jgi:tRNA 5-methylaminomethyl-2-thiouridine biosynthesis bifunctional protein